MISFNFFLNNLYLSTKTIAYVKGCDIKIAWINTVNGEYQNTVNGIPIKSKKIILFIAIEHNMVVDSLSALKKSFFA